MKKKILISLLTVSFLNYVGCYSYSTITREDIENEKLLIGESFIIIEKDDNISVCSPCSFIEIDYPSNFVIGKGEIYNKVNGNLKYFEGRIEREMVDSSKFMATSRNLHTVYWLKNNTRVVFNVGNFLDITPELGRGYYIGNGLHEGEMIEFGKIKEIQMEKINPLNTTLLILSILGFFALIFIGSVVLTVGGL